MEFVIIPYVGIGEVKFGMSRHRVRQVFGGEVKEFKKTPKSETLTDAFDHLGVYVSYKKDETCEAIEMALPATPTLNGVKIINLPFFEVKDFLQNLDDTLEIDETGLLSFKLGVGLYVPSLSESQKEIVESVIVFEKGYYD